MNISSNWPAALLADSVMFTAMYFAYTTGNSHLQLTVALLYWLILLLTMLTVFPYVWLSNRVDELDDATYSTFKDMNNRYQRLAAKRSFVFYIYDSVTDVMYVMVMWMLFGAPVTAIAYVGSMFAKYCLLDHVERNRNRLFQ